MEYKSYSFDLDDNLLKLPTKVYLFDKNGDRVEYSTGEFEKIRNKLDSLGLKIDEEKSFSSFMSDEEFLKDIENASLAGSWRNLKKCMIKHGSIFAIITARGHSVNAIRIGLKKAILNNFSPDELEEFRNKIRGKFDFDVDCVNHDELIEKYFDYCRFYPVSNEDVARLILAKNKNDISYSKYLSFIHFREHVKDYVKRYLGEGHEVKIGFSDDSIDHLKVMINNILRSYGLFFYQTDEEGKSSI